MWYFARESTPMQRSPALRRLVTVSLINCAMLVAGQALAGGGALEIRDGYFWDPLTQEYFVSRGIAYQTWNPPVFANQSFDQVEYDLREFKKMRANSLRVEFVWSEVEVENDVFDWTKPDFLVKKAEELGLKLFVIIGFQYPPLKRLGGWFPDELLATNDRVGRTSYDGEEVSDVLNYEHPDAQGEYIEYITNVVERYKDKAVIGGWILGNEFAYFDLWEPPSLYPARRFLGYDPVSLKSFHEFLSKRYDSDIAALNAKWNSEHASFDSIAMPEAYPFNRNDPGYHDVLQWRQKSIGDFIARGAKAVKDNDPNHLITYSMVGGVFSPNDANNTCEDGPTIVESCKDIGAPLDFWSINNYAWATEGTELRTGDYGITKYQEQLGLPVMLSETGHTSTETFLPGAPARQPMTVPGQLWEALMSGAIGVHLFHWSDRNAFAGDFIRERGFGIVTQQRLPKTSVYRNTLAMLTRLEEIGIDSLLGGSVSPPADIQFFWSRASDMVWPSANMENTMLWGALKRAGYHPRLIDDEDFARGEYRNAKALLLSRAYHLEPEDLDKIANEVIAEGIHVHANADLPGQYNTYHQPNGNWPEQMKAIFGLDVSNADPVWDSHLIDGETHIELIIRGLRPLGSLMGTYSERVTTWKIWGRLRATSNSRTILLHEVANDIDSAPAPALLVKDHGSAKTALNTFAIGDTNAAGLSNPGRIWDFRSDVLKAIYTDHFGMNPTIRLAGDGAQYVISDYRICWNGSILISLLNESSAATSLSLSSPDLLADGKLIEDLTSGGLLNPVDGKVPLSLTGDEFVLLYVYNDEASSTSLVNPSPHKLWIESAPTTVWPSGAGFEVIVGYDTRETELQVVATLEGTRPHGSSDRMPVNGTGTVKLTVPVPDADLQDPYFRSTSEGGMYRICVRLLDRGAAVSETELSVVLSFGVRPTTIPENPVAGGTYAIDVEWESLPSYEPDEDGTPMNRAALWDSGNATREHYNIVLELRKDVQVVASDVVVTRDASGKHTMEITVPDGATGPFHWVAFAQTAPGASEDVFESFEGKETGATIIWPPPDILPPPREVPLLAPWSNYTYSEVAPVSLPFGIYQNDGVQFGGSHGSQSIFIVTANPPDVGLFSGFGIRYEFDTPRSFVPTIDALKNYRFGFDYRESAGLPSSMQLQLVDSRGAIVMTEKEYVPDEDLWDSMNESLNQFDLASFSVPPNFDWNNVSALIINIPMLETGVLESGDPLQYVATIDNIIFDGPERVVSTGIPVSIYTSANDSKPDADGDGLSDVDEAVAGTDLENPDTDEDGQGDGSEILAGTDPNSPSSHFQILSITRLDSGGISLEWSAVPGRLYFIESAAVAGNRMLAEFRAIPGHAEIRVDVAGVIERELSRTVGNGPMLYRVGVEYSE
ncbi:MAG: hypothetical protein ACI9R3_001446 [Verrucomicrobiales bacterium]|jgi:hypothetical protein